jgi:hypothetical protein
MARFFWHLFLEALAFDRNFKVQKFLHFLEEQISIFFFKCCQKINSKWPLNSRWRPKQNLLVKTKNHLFSKKNFRAVFALKFALKFNMEELKIFQKKF